MATEAELLEKKKRRTFRKFTYRGVDLDQLLDMNMYVAGFNYVSPFLIIILIL